MAAMNTEREYVFEQRDLEVMQIAGGQLSVAVENARLFAEEQRRARQFAFLNSISKTAISSEDSEQMLAEIVSRSEERRVGKECRSGWEAEYRRDKKAM